MKLGFICPNTPGHINPMTALARHLQIRNHDVVFLYSSAAAGLPCIPDDAKDEFNENRAEISKKSGESGTQQGMVALMRQAESTLRSLPRIVERNEIDALVIDCIQFYAELGAIQYGVPYVHVSNALQLDFSGHTPLSIYDWPHETTPEALARNRDGVARFVRAVQDANSELRAQVAAAGMKIDWADLSSTLSSRALINQLPKAFDFDSSHWPSHWHHTGPFHDGKGREPVNFPWERITGQPLVYASMGTILNGRIDVFQTIVEAVAKNKGLQLVLSVGDQIDPAQLEPAPKNAIIVKQAPQLELLKQASVCITHAGLNTVLESLAQGVPQVAIPVTFDQPGVATRIAHCQTGVVISLDKLTPDRLSRCVNEALEDPTYRNNSRKLQMEIARANGLSVAADIVERALK
jgi:zeaxanthin glucosyltransferase